MTQSLCSIIIPTYNHGKYIERSVQCALDQTYPNVEVLVVDDGSTDDTPERVRKFGDRIIYIRKENTGRGDSRNRALERSSGEYIQFLDADDTIDPEKLAKQIPILEGDESVAVVYSDCSCNDESGIDQEDASYALREDEDPLPILVRRTLFGIHAGITRRSAIIDVGMFDAHALAQEDWDLWLKLALRGYKYKYIPGRLAHYDQRGSSTVVDAPLMYRRMWNMLQKYLNNADFIRLDPVLINEFVAHQNFQLATRAYNNRWWSASRKHFMAAARADRSVMTSQYWWCIPKSYLHELSDRLRRNQAILPE
jgi:glycosyltransferase involved in cell wall biosynthesis